MKVDLSVCLLYNVSDASNDFTLFIFNIEILQIFALLSQKQNTCTCIYTPARKCNLPTVTIPTEGHNIFPVSELGRKSTSEQRLSVKLMLLKEWGVKYIYIFVSDFQLEAVNFKKKETKIKKFQPSPFKSVDIYQMISLCFKTEIIIIFNTLKPEF